MNEDALFLIAIGGTGMRCLESFVHLCAIGLFDSKEINILTLDTDQSNGNLDRVTKLIHLYNKIKSPSERTEDQGGRPRRGTFFSAKLTLTSFFPKYPVDASYKTLAKLSNESDDSVRTNRDLASLFLTHEAQDFHLQEGYRAQTQLGSHLMYLAIMEAAMRVKEGKNFDSREKSLIEYIEKLAKCEGSARVFLFGSVFGGTGASSIPVVPRAFQDAWKHQSGALGMKASFGASLLTEYFKFKTPTEAQRNKPGQSVIADSNYFTLNSQAALQFYQDDKTVEENYKSLYTIGWPVEAKDFSAATSSNETIAGGKAQRNPCHIIELVSAFAAHHFFHNAEISAPSGPEFYFRTVEFKNNTFHFSFEDMVDGPHIDKLKNALAGFYSIALMTLVFHKGANENTEGITGWIDRAKKSAEVGDAFDDLDKSSKENINNYFKSFLFSLDANGAVQDGWLYQVKSSFNGHFLLPEMAFGSNLQQIENINSGALLPDAKNQWANKKGPFGLFSKAPSDIFVERFIEQRNSVEDAQGKKTVAKERLIAQLYNTVTTLQAVIKSGD